jgi:cell division protein ZapE
LNLRFIAERMRHAGGIAIDEPTQSRLMTREQDPTGSMSVIELYRHALERRGYLADGSQMRAVERLQQLYEEWSAYKARRSTALRKLLVRPPLPRGVYLWGAVGRGKSFLLDSFFRCLPLERKRRVHFHDFMRDVHRQLAELKDRENPLDALAGRIARHCRLICFDEFHVNDIADAMILARLLERTLARGVVYCMTSNYPPDALYRDGLKRENFLAAITLVKQHMDVLQVDGGVDYRLRALEQVKAYHTPLGEATDAALWETFHRIAETGDEEAQLEVQGRALPALHRAGGLAWFDFMVLCGWGRSQHDYLELARRFHTVIVSGVPRMGPELADEARRFTLLVDVFYDQRVKLIVSAEALPGSLLKREEAEKYVHIRAMMFEFDRTASRLAEMQTRQYLEQPRREF